MVRLSYTLLSLLLAASLTSCTLESFEVEACQLDEDIGFKIAPIDGWLRDYQPRPHELHVRIADSRPYEEAVVWATSLSHVNFDSRIPRKIIPYGQQIAGWEVQRPPKPLSEGVRYSIWMSDGGHNGGVEFKVGKQLPVC